MNRKKFYLLAAVLYCSTAVFGQRTLAEQRAQILLGKLTLEEKVALMQNSSPAIPRLGIKAYDWWSEALHGVARAGIATVFPQAIGMGASFDDDLLYQTFTAVSDEARAKSAEFAKNGGLKIYQGLTFWTPNVNIFRDPRWGRGQETYGEDPYLTSRMGVSVVRGLQGPEDAEYDKLHACAKHFAVHSGPEWNRHSFDAKDIDPRDLWETYLPAFKDLVQKGNVREVMCAYNRFEGDPCCGSNRLLMQILRDEWGYKGLVVSDCWAISDFYRPNAHQTHPDAAHASASAVLNGTDLECGPEFGHLTEAVKEGLIDEARIDASLLRLLTARYQLGEMDSSNAWPIPYSVVNSKPHQDLALRMARESIVLLQNKDNILPLDKKLTVAVMGPNANDSVMQWGNYNGFPAHTVTLLEGIRAKLPDGQVIYEPGCEHTGGDASLNLQAAVDKVKDADVVIFAGGISPALEGEEMPVTVPGFKGGDRTDIELPEIQRSLVKALVDAGKKVIFVNYSGSAVALTPESERCEAILQAWYPGQAGGTAVADVLFGDYNPAGRLPITFYKNTAQLPDFEDYSMKGRTYRYFKDAPLFPFGYGLSYTTFAYGDAHIYRADNAKNDMLLYIPVTNTGKREGEEVVQVYLRKPGDTDAPQRTLRGFKRVKLNAGQQQEVCISLTDESFEWFDTNTNTMHPVAGNYELLYGGSSRLEDLKVLPVEIK
ncbi:glycoside hydrolase family 3 C-terminal domain-containing protein [Bacteroides sp. GD17]|jgi:beta-glucosidase|uniref:glycoside hydrolase family 3 C-terminal domain-containing protein n=1 Tax=Bacteroides sp. GD17 TaxID=3139826 RepID=UPI0025EDBC30|nr:glycoside hydrolase family 3 C-terminal domain-containing protein [uncultured Bacteroides sp.]